MLLKSLKYRTAWLHRPEEPLITMKHVMEVLNIEDYVLGLDEDSEELCWML